MAADVMQESHAHRDRHGCGQGPTVTSWSRRSASADTKTRRLCSDRDASSAARRHVEAGGQRGDRDTRDLVLCATAIVSSRLCPAEGGPWGPWAEGVDAVGSRWLHDRGCPGTGGQGPGYEFVFPTQPRVTSTS